MNNNSLLSFNDLRMANVIRLPQFKNAKGEPAHSKADGSDWTPADWITAITGELGEAANIVKKLKRGDFSAEGSDEYKVAIIKLAKEIADVQIYLDLLAYQYRLDLGKCVKIKFNEVSIRVGADVFLTDSGVERRIKEGDLKEVTNGLSLLGVKP